MARRKQFDVDGIKVLLGFIEENKDKDPERAHSDRDVLYEEVLMELDRRLSSRVAARQIVQECRKLVKATLPVIDVKMKWYSCG